jgi:hypothetical protein
MPDREREPFPQRLKPDRFAITNGRPEGRPLQGSRFFRSPFSRAAKTYTGAKALIIFGQWWHD